ncbi:MAG: hypothetical protein Q9191_007630 [Dirinaria sp. TL-2023a]
MGVPPLIGKQSDFQTISRLSHEYLTSDPDLATQTEIQRIVAKASVALQEQSDDTALSRIAGVRDWKFDLENLRYTSKGGWSTATEMQYLAAKLFTYGWSFPFQGETHYWASNDASQPLASLRQIMHEAMQTAISIIHTYKEVPRQTPNSHAPPQIHYPKPYFFSLYYAVATLYLFLSSYPNPMEEDRVRCMNHIRDAHTLFTRCSLNNPRNQWARLAYNLELLGKWHASGHRKLPPEARLRSRMGASLFYDAMQKIAVLKAERGGRSYSSDLTKPLPDRDVDRERTPALTNEHDILQPDPENNNAIANLKLHDNQANNQRSVQDPPAIAVNGDWQFPSSSSSSSQLAPPLPAVPQSQLDQNDDDGLIMPMPPLDDDMVWEWGLNTMMMDAGDGDLGPMDPWYQL